jgi:hypothetical protein
LISPSGVGSNSPSWKRRQHGLRRAERDTAFQKPGVDEVSLVPAHLRQLPGAFRPTAGFDEVANPKRKFYERFAGGAFELAITLFHEEMSAPVERDGSQGLGTL